MIKIIKQQIKLYFYFDKTPFYTIRPKYDNQKKKKDGQNIDNDVSKRDEDEEK